MTTGQKIKVRREQIGLTAAMLAEAAGVTANTIYNYERDKTDPHLFQLTCIADVLGVSLGWLAGRRMKERWKVNERRCEYD